MLCPRLQWHDAYGRLLYAENDPQCEDGQLSVEIYQSPLLSRALMIESGIAGPQYSLTVL